MEKSRIWGPEDKDKLTFQSGEYGWESFSRGWVGNTKEQALKNYFNHNCYFNQVELSEEDEYIVHIDGGQWKYFIEALDYPEVVEASRRTLDSEQITSEIRRILNGNNKK